MYQELYEKTKNIIKQDVSMNFYGTSKPLYLVTDALGISWKAGLL